MTQEIVAMNQQKMNTVDKEDLLNKIKAVVTAVAAVAFTEDAAEFVRQVFEEAAVAELLVQLSRLPVFDKTFAIALSHDLDLLALAKKLKYYTNLPLGQNLLLLQQVLQRQGVALAQYDSLLIKLVEKHAPLSNTRFKDYVAGSGSQLRNNQIYAANNVELESVDPHAIQPTSIQRHCDGLTLATKDSQTIEAVMSTTLTTTIKITNDVLEPSNRLLADLQQPLGRCVAIVGDKVVKHYGKQLDAYFKHFGLECIQLVHNGNEIDKDISNVEKILIELKNNGVARNEPVLIMGGGVIADIGGFATALQHRNTPYVMLATSIVTGIDAGPSPRTCCDGYGFKNLYGAQHPPVLTLTSRGFWSTLHEGWIRHGIAEIIKMACVKDLSLFELVEQAGPRLIQTKFGTVGDTDPAFEQVCDLIVGKAMEGQVRAEQGNLWETHQCRPHAFGHTWSPGYELPAGMLHGHAVATCMGYGSYLALLEGFITEAEFRRILALLSKMELAMWHPIMDNHELVAAANKKAHQKRGGNLCAPVPRELGKCGYINELSRAKIDETLDAYKAICLTYPRGGQGVDVHCHDVGLEDPSTVAGDALKGLQDQNTGKSGATATDNKISSYNEWIQTTQTDRNAAYQNNVRAEPSPDTAHPPKYAHYALFHEGAEQYANDNSSLVSKDLQYVAAQTTSQGLFAPCMVGALESQFLKMLCSLKGARAVLDVGTFTGMSALAFAEALPHDGKVVTLECDAPTAQVARAAFDRSAVAAKLDLRVGAAAQLMKQLKEQGATFDIVFLDADKENYIEYYELALDGLLAKDGVILADNSLCALLYDDSDVRSQKLHEFNQHVKNDSRTEQVVLTIREGITMIKRI